MDKHKIIDEVLAEWAMRSPDGLVGGHDTPENIAVLNEILDEYRGQGTLGKKFLQPYDPKDAGLNPNKDPSKWYVQGHKKIKDGTPYSQIYGTKISHTRENIPPPEQSDEDKAREDLNLKYFRPFHGKWETNDPETDEYGEPLEGEPPAHPTYLPGTRYIDIKLNRATGRKKSSAIGRGVVSVGRPALKSWSVESIASKGFNPATTDKIYDALEATLDVSDIKDFLLNGYNKLMPDQAVEFINDRFERYRHFLNALDDARSTAGRKSSDDDQSEGSATGSRAGRGEIILVLLIAGAKSGGIKSGDIEVNGKVIEVKEIVSEMMRVSKTAIGGSGGFGRLKYVYMINQLANFCNMKSVIGGSSERTRGEVLKKLCNEAPIWGKYEKFKDDTLNFFDDPSFESLTPSTIYGLEIFSSYIRNLNAEEEKEIEQNIEKALVPNTVEFDLNKKTTVMQIQAMSPESKAVVLNPSRETAPQPVTMTVAPITKDEEEGSKLIIPAAKRLEIFKFAGSKDKIYTPKKVAEDMFDLMQAKYTGGIIFFEAKGGFYYEKDLSNLKYGDWYFYAYAQTGPSFRRDTPEELKK